MGPKTPVPEEDFFHQPLREQINLGHPLVRLADLIDREQLNASMSASFVSHRGRPATSPRLISGLPYLQHAFDLSDEDVVWQWLENPYWQMFTGETYLQTKPPVDPSSLTRWRKQLGEAGVEELLAETIEAAKRANVIKTSSLKRVIVDTTVMEKAIAHPTDSRLLERCREHLVAEALELAAILSNVQPEIAVVDRGYKGVAVDGVKVYHPGLRRSITRGLRAMIRRRSAIEPAIGHIKADGKLGRD